MPVLLGYEHTVPSDVVFFLQSRLLLCSSSDIPFSQGLLPWSERAVGKVELPQRILWVTHRQRVVGFGTRPIISFPVR